MTVQLEVWGRKLEVDTDEAKEEREHLERSLAERFNFYLLWVALVTAAAFAVGDSERVTRIAILIFGLVVSVLLWWTLWRTFTKLAFSLSIMRGACPMHASRLNHDSPLRPWRPSEKWLSRTDDLAAVHDGDGSIRVQPPKFFRLAQGVMFFMAGWIPLACTIGLGVLVCISIRH